MGEALTAPFPSAEAAEQLVLGLLEAAPVTEDDKAALRRRVRTCRLLSFLRDAEASATAQAGEAWPLPPWLAAPDAHVVRWAEAASSLSLARRCAASGATIALRWLLVRRPLQLVAHRLRLLAAVPPAVPAWRLASLLPALPSGGGAFETATGWLIAAATPDLAKLESQPALAGAAPDFNPWDASAAAEPGSAEAEAAAALPSDAPAIAGGDELKFAALPAGLLGGSARRAAQLLCNPPREPAGQAAPSAASPGMLGLLRLLDASASSPATSCPSTPPASAAALPVTPPTALSPLGSPHRSPSSLPRARALPPRPMVRPLVWSSP